MSMRPAHILVVDDDPQIVELLVKYLHSYDMSAGGAANPNEARHYLTQRDVDLMILDVMMPGENGLSFCQSLRAETSRPYIPIIMLTAKGESTDRVVGLELGADDYVIKPFEPRELVARIRSVLRRIGQTSIPASTADQPSGDQVEPESIRFENWTLQLATRELISPSSTYVPLSNAEFRLLKVFLERPRRVLSRDVLMDLARGRSLDAFDRSIDLLVSRLRAKLDEEGCGQHLLKTVRGEGYMLDVSQVRP